jgi:hypothetical protein
MKFVTSISPNRLEHQIACINTWKDYATEIVAVRTPDEPILEVPSVRFVTTDKLSTEFNSKCPRIYSLIEECPGIIINSDISIVSPMFLEKFAVERHKVLDCGIRYDDNKLNKYGIDVFKITDELKAIYKDTPFGVGQPGWDYYFVIEAHRNGFFINAHKSPMIFHHQVHELNWTRWKLTLAQSFLERLYNKPSTDVTKEILRLTGRQNDRTFR